MAGGRGGWRGGRSPWEAAAEIPDGDVLRHIDRLDETGLGLGEYARELGLQRRRLAEGIRRVAPDRYAGFVAAGVISEQVDKGRSGTRLETSAKGMLERRGYYVVKSFASKGALDLLAVGLGRPPLMVQAKKDGALPFEEWNLLYDTAVAHGCWPVLVRRPPGESKGALWFRLAGRKERKHMPSAPLLEPFDPARPEQAALPAA